MQATSVFVQWLSGQHKGYQTIPCS